MRGTVRTRLAAAAIAVAAGGGIAVTAPASPAVAFFSPPLFLDIRVLSPAQLVAGGAAVQVPVEVTCTSDEAFVSVTVTQRVGKRLAKGNGFADVGCTRSREQVIVTVVADQGTSFTKGTAFAEGQIFGCAPSVCGAETDQTTIEIRR
jgi:hypothetical protein